MSKFIVNVLTLAVSVSLAVAPVGSAEHIIPAETLRQDMQAAVERRDAQLETLQSVFESDAAKQALGSVGMSAEKVTSAVSALDDASLEELAARAESFQADMAAGALNNQQITYILIALGTAVVILVIVAA